MTPPSEERIGARIRRLRQERGLSLRDLAAPGVTYTYLSRVESGHRTPSVKAIRQIARGLGLSPDYVETGIELHTREELELALSDLELAVRLEPHRKETEPQFRRILERAKTEGADDIAAKAGASLGMALSGWGRPEEACRLLEAALAHPAATPDVFTQAYVTLAITYRQLGREREAAHLCQDALDRTPAEDGAVRVVLATYLSFALADVGEYARAERVLEELVGHVDDADPYSRARVHWSLARVEAMQDKRRDALRHMRKAISLLNGTEDTLLLARAHRLCAEILLWGGRTNGVDSHLRAAAGLLPPNSSSEDTFPLAAINALFAARTGRWVDALRFADRALSGPVDANPSATYARALACAATSAHAEADEAYAETLALLEERNLWREASLVAQDRATALASAGNQREADRWWRAADDYAARLKAKLTRA